VAPKLLGNGTAAINDLGISTLNAALQLHVDDVTLVGDDVRITASTEEATCSLES
jgi:riboflavin biosynthesis pyrimidine reductase